MSQKDKQAGMAELADAPDLGSGGRPCRFKSCYPHKKDPLGLFCVLTSHGRGSILKISRLVLGNSGCWCLASFFDLNIEKISLDHKNLRRMWLRKIFL